MARTKECFSRQELPRVWLRQSQQSGRTSDNLGGKFYFEGATIYSYGSHFPIARLYDAPNGEKIILFTTRTYSRTTNCRHIPAVQIAIRDSNRRVISCSSPDGISHGPNLHAFQSDMDTAIAKHARARKSELYCTEILYQAHLAREYCEVFCLPVPLWAMLPELSSDFIDVDKLFRGEPLRAILAIQQGVTA